MENSNGTAKVISILDYIGILWILGLFVEKENEDVRFHTNQGLILFIVEIIASVVSTILGFIPIVGTLIGALLSVACFVLAILGIVNAAKGVREPLPIIGSLFTIIK